MMKHPIHNFTLNSYIEMIEALLKQGYQAVSYAEANPAKKHVILRHDIDFELDAAVEMAKREYKHELRATYFILLRGEFYNIASDTGLTAIHKLAALGHDIGLHFDAAIYDTEKTSLSHEVSKEAEVLASLTGLPINAMSLHRPHPNLLEQEFDTGSLINSYAKKFFKEFGYCSDSNGGWHYDYPLDHPSVDSGQGLHLLTHPIWWVGHDNGPVEKLRRFLEKRATFLDDQLVANCKLFSKYRSDL